MITSFICMAVIVIIDQITKFIVYGSPARSIIGNLLWFESTLNTGVAFSMFEGNSWVFIITSSLASILFVYLIISKKWLKTKFEKISISLILAGTLSNLVDRIIFKGVRDFIYLKFINFAIFNVADMAITIGTILFCVCLVFLRKPNKEEKESSKEEDVGA